MLGHLWGRKRSKQGETACWQIADGKRFWFQVVFAEVTSKEELLDSLVRMSPTSAEDSLAQSEQ